MATNLYIENYVPAIKNARAIETKLPITLVGSSASITAGGGITTLSGAAATSGGNVTPAVVVASTTTGSGVGIYFGAGAPTITAPQGSLYLNTTGSSTSTRAYVNTTGSTTWTAVTTAA